MKGIIIGLVLAVLLAQSVNALDWKNSCLNDTHLFRESALNYNGTEYSFNQTVYCEYNCSNITLACMPNQDNPNPPNIFAAVLVLMGVAAMFLFIAFSIKERHPELGLMFLIIPLFFMSAALGLVAIPFNVSTMGSIQNIVYSVMFAVIVTAILTIFIFLLKIIVATLKTLLNPRNVEKELKEL